MSDPHKLIAEAKQRTQELKADSSARASDMYDAQLLVELADALVQALEEIALDDELLERRNRLLAMFPECPEHGQCIPYAEETLKRLLALEGER